jgi:murein L,D-transpeptidase YafK
VLAPKLFDDMLRKTKDFNLKANLVILIKTLKTHGNLRSWSYPGNELK